MTQTAGPLLLSVFSTFAVGGPQVRFAALVNHFGRTWRHAIIAMDGNLDCAKRLSPELDIVFPEVTVQPGVILANLPRFRRVLRDLAPDVLVTHNWGSTEWAMANLWPNRIRHVHIEDGFGPEEAQAQLRRRILTRSLVLRRSTVILPSLTLQKIASETWRLPTSKLHYIPNGLDLDRFQAGEAGNTPMESSGKPPVIGTVAALRPEKNLLRLLRAAKLLIDSATALRLVIVGDGPERTRIAALASELGISDAITFAGSIQDPAAAYREFDVFALSSDTEQMPLSVLEAMASGLPVAATRVGDVPHMLAAENEPFLCEKDDASLAEALRPLLHDAQLRRVVGAANRRKAERHFDQRIMFRSYGELLGTPLTWHATGKWRSLTAH